MKDMRRAARISRYIDRFCHHDLNTQESRTETGWSQTLNQHNPAYSHSIINYLKMSLQISMLLP